MAKGVEVKRDFKVLREVISPENVLVMAELITIKQTKCLIGYYVLRDSVGEHYGFDRRSLFYWDGPYEG